MRKRLAAVGIAWLIFGAAVHAHATMMQGIWTGTVLSVEGPEAVSIWSAGDLFTFSFIFDGAGTTSNEYHDGANGKDNDGSVDDILNTTFDLGVPGDSFEMRSDINYELDLKTNNLLPSVFDATEMNFQSFYVFPAARGFYIEVLSDGLYIFLNDANGTIQYARSFDSDENGEVSFENVNLTTEPLASEVPVPTTILLFASGLAGLAGIRNRFNKSA